MVRFIMFSMAIIVCSFAFAPVFSGISKEHNKIIAINQSQITEQNNDLSFEEIYELADSALENNPELLNNILPAAGENTEEEFSMGFSYREDSALENTPRLSIIEQDIL